MASAVCSYDVESIRAAFDGNFDVRSIDPTYRRDGSFVPVPRPGAVSPISDVDIPRTC